MSKNKVFIMCPAYIATGGTELLHQLHSLLIKQGIDSNVYYTEKNSVNRNYTPYRFKKYVSNHQLVDKVEDNEDDFLIVPEIYFPTINYKKIKLLFWWLSVDNFLLYNGYKTENITKNNIKRDVKIFLNLSPYNKFKDILKKPNIIYHLYQSEYANLFLAKLRIKNRIKLSDFINKEVIYTEAKEKRNIIAYNPQKGIEVIKYLIHNAPEKYEWAPVENLKPSEIAELLAKSKLYVDFGNHPGKDRIPREAVLNNCCILTNQKGAARNSKDIPINKKYKFKDPIKQSSAIYKTIKNIFEDFDIHQKNFNKYKNHILNEEIIFEKEISQLLKRIKLI